MFLIESWWILFLEKTYRRSWCFPWTVLWQWHLNSIVMTIWKLSTDWYWLLTFQYPYRLTQVENSFYHKKLLTIVVVLFNKLFIHRFGLMLVRILLSLKFKKLCCMFYYCQVFYYLLEIIELLVFSKRNVSE